MLADGLRCSPASNSGGRCGDFPCADPYLTRLTGDSQRMWTVLWGTTTNEYASAVVAAGGKVLVAGGTAGDLAGASAGDADAFFTLFAPPGSSRR